MGNRAVSLMPKMAVIISLILSMVLGLGFNTTPDGQLYFGANFVFAAGEGWLGTWENRIALNIDGAKIDSILTDFPVMVHLSASSGINDADMSTVFDELASDANRKKIAVTTSDGETQCYVEIEQWDDANEQAWLWFKAPLITTSQTTFYLYYDAAQPANTSYVGDVGDVTAQNVWNSGYVGVYHFSESGNGTTDEFKDSTYKAHHATGGASVTAYTEHVSNKVGNSNTNFGNVQWFGQSFTPNTNVTVDHVAVKLNRTGIAVGNFTVDIYAASGDNPIGDSLATGTIACSTIALNSPAVYHVALSSPVNLTGGTKYVFIARAIEQSDNTIFCYIDTASGYGDGKGRFSGNSGSTWSDYYDMYFIIEEYTGTAPETKCTSQVDSKIGKGQFFDGDNDIIIISDHDDFSSPTTGYLTIEHWLSPHTLSWTNENISGYINWFGKGDSSWTQWEWLFTLKGANHPDEHLIGFYQHAMTGGLGVGSGYNNAWEIDEWICCAARLRVSDTTVWMDIWYEDDTHAQDMENYSPIVAGNGTADVTIGTAFDGLDELFEGGFDELRFSNVFRSDAWLKASKYSSGDNLIYFGDYVPPTNSFDVNGDGQVNVLDMILIGQHQGESGQPGWITEDINMDGTIDVLDMILIGQNWTG